MFHIVLLNVELNAVETNAMTLVIGIWMKTQNFLQI